MNALSQSAGDLSALSWVHDELRKSLESAHKALRRFVKESQATHGDLDSVDPSVLRTARQHLHQGAGALELVGLPAAATILRASEAAVQRCSARGHALDAAAVETIERASFALLDFVARRLAGQSVSPLAMFAQYKAVQELAGADRIHPADLWPIDWHWRDMPAAPGVAPLPDAGASARMEPLLLGWMRGDAGAASALSDLGAALAAGAQALHERVVWQLAAAFFEALAQRLLAADVYTKRVAARLLAQLRGFERGDLEVSERLAQDLLFFCARARLPHDAERSAARLWAVRTRYAPEPAGEVDYETASLGRFDPAWLAQARKRVAGAKEVWSGVAGGELARLVVLGEHFALVGDSLQRLFESGADLAGALKDVAAQAMQSQAVPPPELAMEVATALLYVEASLEESDFGRPEQTERVAALAGRIRSAQRGDSAGPLEPWMEELYRRVSDRQTMGTVVQELRTSLAEAEKSIDRFFRAPGDREPLASVPAQLASMRGVLSVLGMDEAALATLRMRDDVSDLIALQDFDPAAVAASGTFERMAANFGALGFLIDMLGVQPQLAKTLFVYDAQARTFSPVMGRREQRHPAYARRDAPATREQARGALPELEAAAGTQGEAPAGFGERAAVTAPPPLEESIGAGEDDEMRSVFLEEAREVIAGARDAVGVLQGDPAHIEKLTEVRRAFHTLKGSGRMVGLDDFGAAAWACEQLYNARLAEAALADADMLAFTTQALAYLADWVDAIEARRARGHSQAAVTAAADALRTEGRLVPLPLPAAEGAAQAEPIAAAPAFVKSGPLPLPESFESLLPPGLPSAADLDLRPPQVASSEVPFDLELRPLDAIGLPGEMTAPARTPAQPVPKPLRAALPIDGFLSDIDLDFDLPPEPKLLIEEPAETPLPELPPAGDSQIGLEASDFALAPKSAPAAKPGAPEPLPSGELEPLELEPLDTGSAEPPFAEGVDVTESAATDSALAELFEPFAFGAEARRGELAEAPEALLAPEALPADQAAAAPEAFKTVGPLRIPIALFNIYLAEADDLSQRLAAELSRWSLEQQRPIAESAAALAHSLAGSSATVGLSDLAQLARSLEHALMHADGAGDDEARLLVDIGDEIRVLLHQFAAGFLRSPPASLLDRVAGHEAKLAQRSRAAAAASAGGEAMAGAGASSVEPSALQEPVIEPVLEPEAPAIAEPQAEPQAEPARGAPEPTPLPAPRPEPAFAPIDREIALDDDIDAVDAVDSELFPVFEEEGLELIPQLARTMHEWQRDCGAMAAASACMRTLHTLKGGARLAGAMRLGEMAHRLETAIEHLIARGGATAGDVELLQARVDAIAATFEALRTREAELLSGAAAAPAAKAEREAAASPPVPAAPARGQPALEQPGAIELPAPDIDWSRFIAPAASVAAVSAVTLPERRAGDRAGITPGSVRVRAALLERLVNHAGEVSMTRARVEGEIVNLRSSVNDLNDNLERLRRQLRDLELQAETQIASRMEAARAAQAFDPLEMDRFTRFQELTRMMAESVNDVATVQRTLGRTLAATEDELAAQARLTRELQDDLLRTRMVQFDSLSDRLYRVVRQAAKETGKQVRLDIAGGATEIDRGVLERMTGAFEHLLRNCVTHGIEMPEARVAAGKDAAGTVVVTLTQEGNEVGVEVRDDGAGLNLPAIRAKGLAAGLLQPEREHSDADLANLIFAPGFSTAALVTELAGRGVGMDVVRADVNAMGGRIETSTAAGQGTAFKLVLPLTTAVTQVVMLRCGDMRVAVPATLLEGVVRAKPEEIGAAYANGFHSIDGVAAPFFWLGALLQGTACASDPGRVLPIVVVRSANQRVALHVDEVLGNQEVVVKRLGAQLSRVPGLAGVTMLASGSITLIYNPVALATVYGEAARERTRAALVEQREDAAASTQQASGEAPLVMVVDDSLTVRRITQRLLVREGYRVVLAKDGLEALDRLAGEKPAVLLSDIEMPRMDGFDLVRNVRGDPRLKDLPIIMITSRIAQKHRDVAALLGVNHYLGKPYSEEELLSLVARYAGVALEI